MPLETICRLSKVEKGEKIFLECEPVDARDHIRNGWVLESKPSGTKVMIGGEASEEVIPAQQATAKKADQHSGSTNKNQNKHKGEASIVASVPKIEDHKE